VSLNERRSLRSRMAPARWTAVVISSVGAHAFLSFTALFLRLSVHNVSFGASPAGDPCAVSSLPEGDGWPSLHAPSREGFSCYASKHASSAPATNNAQLLLAGELVKISEMAMSCCEVVGMVETRVLECANTSIAASPVVLFIRRRLERGRDWSVSVVHAWT
jgi:hypothetical protein